MRNKDEKSLGQKIWFKIFLTILVFLPSYSQIGYDPVNTTVVISEVMSKPLVSSILWILPMAKIILFIVVIVAIFFDRFSERVLLSYYGVILFVIGFLQNMSFTKNYGFVWIFGNTLIQLVVLVFCFYDVLKNKTRIVKDDLVKGRLWIIMLMLLAFLMPYAVDDFGLIKPSFTSSIFLNEAGLTYCMITPIIIGILLLYSKGVHKPTLSIISYVGLIFGILNMITWFGMDNDQWWMGVLHLPLIIISFYGLIIAHKEKTLGYK